MYIDLFRISFLFFVVIIFTSEHFPTSLCIDDEKYVACAGRFRCANMPNLGYPYWGDGRLKHCGHPGFELKCQADVPLINIQTRPYRVLGIDERARLITVAREDLWNNSCPVFFSDTNLDYTLFKHPPGDQNLTLYYGCTTVQPQPVTLPSKFNCTVNGTSSASYYVTRQANLVPNPNLATCSHSIIVPINETAAQYLTPPTIPTTVSDLRAILASGFGLLWEANDSDCNKCIRSGGRCGSNSSSGYFACYCADRPYLFVCPEKGNSSSANSKTLDIVLPVVGAVLASICIGWVIYFCRQRRKRFLRFAQYDSQPQPQPQSKGLPTLSNTDLVANSSIHFAKSVHYPYSISELEKGSTYFGVRIFSYSQLEKATDNFSPSRVLGGGGYGTVYYGTLRDGQVVAVKRLFENNFKRLERFMNEVEILARLQHKNLVKLYGCTSRQSEGLLLVYEYIPNGTVADHLHGKLATSSVLSWSVRLNIAIETAGALAYLHSHGIVHRDVKTNNILLDNSFNAKVADFGLCRLFPTDASHVSTAPQGTFGYVDPLYFRTFQLTEKSDVYSFGVVLIELISSLQAMDRSRRHPNINLAHMAIDKIQNNMVSELVDPNLGTEDDTLVTLVAELGFRCLQEDKEMRPSMQEVVDILRGIQYEEFNGR